jgi:hypothetical protein
MRPITKEDAFLEYQTNRIVQELQELKEVIKLLSVSKEVSIKEEKNEPPVITQQVPVRRKNK